jgi:hypothetical protein
MAETFFLYVRDRRHSVPKLVILPASDWDIARSTALEHLASSVHTESVEIVDFEQNSVVVERKPACTPSTAS